MFTCLLHLQRHSDRWLKQGHQRLLTRQIPKGEDSQSEDVEKIQQQEHPEEMQQEEQPEVITISSDEELGGSLTVEEYQDAARTVKGMDLIEPAFVASVHLTWPFW